jgi:3-phosphoshikimate 1-carboxyvinyltransferase
VPGLIDEIPGLAALAAMQPGISMTVRGARELRVKESDRIALTASMLRDVGVDCVELRDGMTIHGTTGALRAAKVTSHGDHRIAMTGAILGLVSDGETIVDDVGCVDTSFPGFAAMLRSLGADIVVEDVEEETPAGRT